MNEMTTLFNQNAQRMRQMEAQAAVDQVLAASTRGTVSIPESRALGSQQTWQMIDDAMQSRGQRLGDNQ